MMSGLDESDESGRPVESPRPVVAHEAHCVAVVDDDGLVAKALAAALAGPEYDTLVFATAAEFNAALPDLNRRTGCTLVDLRLAEEYGMGLIQSLSGSDAAVHRPNIVISGYADVANTLEAMQLGCWTVLQKPVDLELLRRTVREACQWSRENRARLQHEAEIRRLWATINEKERSTIDMILEGLPNKSVASRLGVSVRTVENRRRQILAKLGISSVAQLGRIVALIDASASLPMGSRRFAAFPEAGRTRNAGMPPSAYSSPGRFSANFGNSARGGFENRFR
jgi:FixJ family two-component response regulator